MYSPARWRPSTAFPPAPAARRPLAPAVILFLVLASRSDPSDGFVGGGGGFPRQSPSRRRAETATGAKCSSSAAFRTSRRAFLEGASSAREPAAAARRRRRGPMASGLGPDGRRRCSCLAATSNDGETGGEDWRDFRAKLVRQECDDGNGEGAAAAAAAGKDDGGGGAWAYDSGDVIERGSVILSRPEQDFGYGLRQQYFHKCVILVLDHDASFTKGVILNRPTDLVLSDEDFVYDDGVALDDPDPDSRWRVWFGGDVRGLHGEDDGDDSPEVTCLHALRSEMSRDVSNDIMRDIRWTTLEGARGLVLAGEARPEDFWVFCGYAGWGGGQLEDELRRESWYTAATDPGTLLEELKSLEQTADVRDAGVGTWEALVTRIGRGDEVVAGEDDDSDDEAAAAAVEGGNETGGDAAKEGEDEKALSRFDDLMLYEWARERLVFSSTSGDTNIEGGDATDNITDQNIEADAAIDAMIRRATAAVRSGSQIKPGTFVRSSPAVEGRSPPFLLDDQEFHKSVVLVLQDDESITVGVLLNLPSAQEADIMGDVQDTRNGGEGASGGGIKAVVPQRYGGRYGVKGQSAKPFVWLHRNADALREGEGVGSPIAGNPDNAWICSREDAAAAVEAGLAAPRDFLVVNGFSIWEKTPVGVTAALVGEIEVGEDEDAGEDDGDVNESTTLETAGGMRGEVWDGRFEVIPPESVPRLWGILAGQEVLTEGTMDANIERSNAAWEWAEPASTGKKKSEGGASSASSATRGAESNLVHNSRTSVGDLADAALRSWIATFLLGDPDLRGA